MTCRLDLVSSRDFRLVSLFPNCRPHLEAEVSPGGRSLTLRGLSPGERYRLLVLGGGGGAGRVLLNRSMALSEQGKCATDTPGEKSGFFISRIALPFVQKTYCKKKKFDFLK